MDEIEWCPQHGYPLPCAKCGLQAFQTPENVREEVINEINKYQHYLVRYAKEVPFQQNRLLLEKLAKKILDMLKPYILAETQKDGWELQDKLLGMTVLNQTAPKVLLTNDECGWNITYYPDAPYTTGEISLMRGNPLEAVQALWQILQDKEDSHE